MLAYIISRISYLKEISENLFFSVTQFAFICKLTNFMFHGEKLRNIEQQLKQKRFTQLSLHEEKLVMDLIDFGRDLAKIFRVLCFLVVFFYALFPFFDKNSDGSMKLPLPMSFPFKPEDYYYPIYCASIAAIIVAASTNSNIDILTVMLISLGTGQVEVLKHRFENLIPPGLKEPEEIVLEKLKENVRHLDDIYRYIFLYS